MRWLQNHPDAELILDMKELQVEGVARPLEFLDYMKEIKDQVY